MEEHLLIEDLNIFKFEQGKKYKFSTKDREINNKIFTYDKEYGKFHTFKHKYGYMVCILKIDLYRKEILIKPSFF